MLSSRFLNKGEITHRPSPCTWFSQARSTMPHLTPWLLIFAISTPSLLRLSLDTPILVRAARVSHVYTIAFIARHALRLRERWMIQTDFFFLSHPLLPSGINRPWATPQLKLNGAQSLQPCGLRLTTSFAYA